ncbi:hypothetical protein Bbelb_386310 [Branchiostoma belcheri]|nr:hypothetical protein Bbelb_386310 [Branchiostoma belcheri]
MDGRLATGKDTESSTKWSQLRGKSPVVCPKDDTKVWREVWLEEERTALQQDINTVCKWESDWQMQFNVGKCGILHLGHGNPHCTYYMHGVPVSKTEMEKDLGVHVHQSMKPAQQVTKAVKKANQILEVVQQTSVNGFKSSIDLHIKTVLDGGATRGYPPSSS